MLMGHLMSVKISPFISSNASTANSPQKDNQSPCYDWQRIQETIAHFEPLGKHH